MIHSNKNGLHLSHLALAAGLALASVACFPTTAEADDDRPELTIYYLSPQVFVRAAISPSRLKNEVYRIDPRLVSAALEAKALEAVRVIHPTGRQEAGHGLGFDYRLCLAAAPDVIWFDGSGQHGFASNIAFALSENEQQIVSELFRDLDELEGRAAQQNPAK